MHFLLPLQNIQLNIMMMKIKNIGFGQHLKLYFQYVLVSIFIFIFQWIIKLSFQSERFAYILKVFAISILVFLINTLFMQFWMVIDIKKYIILNIVSSIVSLVLVSLLVIYFALDGALLAHVLYQSIVLVVTLIYVRSG